ncbi:ArnT family glycosyltransferase [Lentiprolixibacter aurantiacus]|uniref:Glycosyltransferase family 39 protein n=1 Tax=Lentiprolixibacter aurantiacus TaxID=2993939 RepID=A0AAE3MIY7_9FLAO|nr:glycosyltransferase family 39 protein [Lentiprolixibacter aurantiacus]MCX2718288.1 glycosyltransferase family 39 protein [Lentiprolixibacter aurantiacus]
MQSKGKTSPISIYEKLSGKVMLLILFLLSFFVRFPFFFRDYIDRDESTFILVGQALADGYLPYTHLWDLKPPLIYFLMAGLISLFGKSFIAIRLFGVVAVALTAFFTFEIGRQVFSRKTAVFCSLGTVLLLSLFGSLQGVMSEHLSMLFFMPALLILVRGRSNMNVFLAGLLTGLAIMTKINLAYAALFIAVFLFVAMGRKNTWLRGFINSLWFGLGIMLIILLTILPYIFSGTAHVWWNSVVLAPLEYTRAEPFAPEKILPFIIVIVSFFLFAWRKQKIDFKNPGVLLLFIALSGVCFSFIKGGKINGHYLIQIYPILLLFVGSVVARIEGIQNWKAGPVAVLLLILLPVESYKEYYAVYAYNKERGTYFNGEGISVPDYLKKEGLDNKSVLLFEYHIGYWKLNQSPLTKAATHPSNLCRDQLFPYFENPRLTALEELKYIMEDLKPGIVVVRKDKPIFDRKQEQANAYTSQYIQDHYVLHHTIDRAEIYLRSDSR